MGYEIFVIKSRPDFLSLTTQSHASSHNGALVILLMVKVLHDVWNLYHCHSRCKVPWNLAAQNSLRLSPRSLEATHTKQAGSYTSTLRPHRGVRLC